MKNAYKMYKNNKTPVKDYTKTKGYKRPTSTKINTKTIFNEVFKNQVTIKYDSFIAFNNRIIQLETSLKETTE